jgi:hypothetical protein
MPCAFVALTQLIQSTSIEYASVDQQNIKDALSAVSVNVCLTKANDIDRCNIGFIDVASKYFERNYGATGAGVDAPAKLFHKLVRLFGDEAGALTPTSVLTVDPMSRISLPTPEAVELPMELVTLPNTDEEPLPVTPLTAVPAWSTAKFVALSIDLLASPLTMLSVLTLMSPVLTPETEFDIKPLLTPPVIDPTVESAFLSAELAAEVIALHDAF